MFLQISTEESNCLKIYEYLTQVVVTTDLLEEGQAKHQDLWLALRMLEMILDQDQLVGHHEFLHLKSNKHFFILIVRFVTSQSLTK